MNLLNKIYDFMKIINLLMKKERCNSWKKEIPLVCNKYLSAWTGLGKSGHVQSQSFGSILHVSDSKVIFDEISRWFCMVLRGEAQKHGFETKELKNWRKS